MKMQHDGDCTIYASLSNIGMPEAGICTCGYGHQRMRTGDYSEMYSGELEKKLENERVINDSEIEKIFEEAGWEEI